MVLRADEGGSGTGVYWECANSVLDSSGPIATEELLRCITTTLENKEKQRMDDYRSFLFILCGCLVLSMQGGFAMLCAGCVRKKNVINTMLKNLLDACGAAISFFFVGYALAFGDSSNHRSTTTFIGTQNFLNMASSGSNDEDGEGGKKVDLAFWFFQYTFSAAAVTIVAGALAERCKMIAYLYYSIFLTGFVYPVVAHAVWSKTGFLSVDNVHPLQGIGMIDFAGGGVVHLTGGTTALFAAKILGSRRGRFYDVRTGSTLDTPKSLKGHSISLQMLGTMILWFGWYGFNGGSALLINEKQNSGEVAVHVALNTSLAGAAGGIGVVMLLFINRKLRTGETYFDLTMTLNGALSGLVSITACCGTIEHWAAVITGFIAGFNYILVSKLLISYKIDDAVDAIPVHMANGMWGLLSAGLFSSPQLILKVMGSQKNQQQYSGLFYAQDKQNCYQLFTCQLIGIVSIVLWTSITMFPFFMTLNYLGWLRTESVTELLGFDVQIHGENANTNNSSSDPIVGEDLTRELLGSINQQKKKTRLQRIAETEEG